MNKFIAVFVSLIILLVNFSSCIKVVEDEKDNEEKTGKSTKAKVTGTNDTLSESETESVEPDISYEPTEDDVNPDSEPSSNDIHNGFKAKKISYIDGDKYIYDYYKAGIVYIKDNKFGVLSPDGSIDTGAKYSSVRDVRGSNHTYLTVSNVETDTNNIDSLNSKGVLDSSLNELIPMEYASFEYLSDRYILAIKVTERTDDPGEALLYFESGLPTSIGPSDNAKYFKGIWYIFDTLSRNYINGVQGTKSSNIPSSTDIYGEFIRYQNDDNERKCVNYSGTSLPSGATLFRNGYYINETENEENLIVNAVFDSEGDKLFEYSLDGYIPFSSDKDYIVGRKNVNGSYSYVYMDSTGSIVSPEYTSQPELVGDFVFYNGELFDITGNRIIEGKFDSVNIEPVYNQAYLLKKDSNFTIIDTNGNIMWQGNDDEALGGLEFNMYKQKSDGYYYYYSFKEGDYTIRSRETYDNNAWVIRIEKPDDSHEIVDMISGETLVQGYFNYHILVAKDGNKYVYAFDEVGNADIYKISIR